MSADYDCRVREWKEREICMAIKAYPNPVEDLGEAVCTAGMDRNGEWVRVYPVAFRDLPEARRFKKYQWIRARFRKSTDSRPESFDVDHDSIECLEAVDTANRWARRKELIAPHIVPSVEALWQAAAAGERTMGYVRTRGIPELVIDQREATWDERRGALLDQIPLFGRHKARLERIPFRFAYKYTCEGEACRGHDMQVLDWEMHQAYRQWRQDYGEERWQAAFIERFGPKFFELNDVLFNLGNIAAHPQSFCITGLFYPRKA